jgi:hypothetical protein
LPASKRSGRIAFLAEPFSFKRCNAAIRPQSHVAQFRAEK